MSWPYWKNTFFPTSQLTDEEMKSIEFPGLELGLHITYRSVQVASIFGVLIAGIRQIIKRNQLNKLTMRLRTNRTLSRSVLVGGALGPLLTLGMVYGKPIDQDGLYDRAYRLRHNQGQITTDRAFAITAVPGALVKGLPGIALGSTAGLFALGAYHFATAPPPKPKFVDTSETPQDEQNLMKKTD